MIHKHASPLAAHRRRSRFRTAGRHLRGAPATAWFGLVVMAVYALLAVFAPLIAPHGEAEVVSSQPFAPWSWAYPFGTDQLGRDNQVKLYKAALGIS